MHENAMIYSTSNFDISSTIFDNNRHDSGNNTIGISVVLTHGVEPYLFKYYIPSIAIVTISMMGFTMPLTALPERVALLVTQFLTLTELFIHEMVSNYHNNRISNIHQNDIMHGALLIICIFFTV